MSERDVETLRRIEELERKVKEYDDLKHAAKGAWWMLIKIGVVLATLSGLVIGAWRLVVAGH